MSVSIRKKYLARGILKVLNQPSINKKISSKFRHVISYAKLHHSRVCLRHGSNYLFSKVIGCTTFCVCTQAHNNNTDLYKMSIIVAAAIIDETKINKNVYIFKSPVERRHVIIDDENNF